MCNYLGINDNFVLLCSTMRENIVTEKCFCQEKLENKGKHKYHLFEATGELMKQPKSKRKENTGN